LTKPSYRVPLIEGDTAGGGVRISRQAVECGPPAGFQGLRR
jgi:hypothetical protein